MTYKVHIYLKSFENLYIHTSLNQILQIANYLKNFSDLSNRRFEDQKVISLPTLKKKFTVLRSPHIDKKSREQFEWTHYKKSIFLDFQKISVFSLFLFLLKNSSFPGVQIEIHLKHSTFCKTLPNTFQQYLLPLSPLFRCCEEKGDEGRRRLIQIFDLKEGGLQAKNTQTKQKRMYVRVGRKNSIFYLFISSFKTKEGLLKSSFYPTRTTEGGIHEITFSLL